MSDPGDNGPRDGGGQRPDAPHRAAPRAERLAEALRANLRRRKAQARGRRTATEPPDGAGSAPEDGSESGRGEDRTGTATDGPGRKAEG